MGAGRKEPASIVPQQQLLRAPGWGAMEQHDVETDSLRLT
jgi:hypothetical protein